MVSESPNSAKSSVCSLASKLVYNPFKVRLIRFGWWVVTSLISDFPLSVSIRSWYDLCWFYGPLFCIVDFLFGFLIYVVLFFGIPPPTPTKQVLATRLVRILRLQRPQHLDLLVATPVVSYKHTVSPDVLFFNLVIQPFLLPGKNRERVVDTFVLATVFEGC